MCFARPLRGRHVALTHARTVLTSRRQSRAATASRRPGTPAALACAPTGVCWCTLLTKHSSLSVLFSPRRGAANCGSGCPARRCCCRAAQLRSPAPCACEARLDLRPMPATRSVGRRRRPAAPPSSASQQRCWVVFSRKARGDVVDSAAAVPRCAGRASKSARAASWSRRGQARIAPQHRTHAPLWAARKACGSPRRLARAAQPTGQRRLQKRTPRAKTRCALHARLRARACGVFSQLPTKVYFHISRFGRARRAVAAAHWKAAWNDLSGPPRRARTHSAAAHTRGA
jgi:hypothetical protein